LQSNQSNFLKEPMQVGIGNFISEALRNYLRAHFSYYHNVTQISIVETINSCWLQWLLDFRGIVDAFWV
jgi:hypothetical protein